MVVLDTDVDAVVDPEDDAVGVDGGSLDPVGELVLDLDIEGVKVPFGVIVDDLDIVVVPLDERDNVVVLLVVEDTVPDRLEVIDLEEEALCVEERLAEVVLDSKLDLVSVREIDEERLEVADLVAVLD